MGHALGHVVALLRVDEIIRGERGLREHAAPVGGGDAALAKAETEGIAGAGWRRRLPARLCPGNLGRGGAGFHLGVGIAHTTSVVLTEEEINDDAESPGANCAGRQGGDDTPPTEILRWDELISNDRHQFASS
ncbi:MAG: hypothetical protein GY722_13265 [bacterium]|nr:hypothetical protein [bacterium]